MSSSSKDGKLKLLFFGTIGEQAEVFVKKLQALHSSKAGPFDAAFCVGACQVKGVVEHLLNETSTQDDDDNDNGNDSKQRIRLPLPVFLQETTESMTVLKELQQQHGSTTTTTSPSTPSNQDETNDQDDNTEEDAIPSLPVFEIIPNLYFLRNTAPPHRVQVWSLPLGQNAARRSIDSSLVVAACPSHFRSDSKATAAELLQGIQHVSYRGCDILLSTEWPQGIETIVPTTSTTTSDDASNNNNNNANISFDIADIALQARARYHVAVGNPATEKFVQSPPFAHLRSTTNTVTGMHAGRFLALGSVVDAAALKQRGGNKATKFVHALGLKPLQSMSRAEWEELSSSSNHKIAACPFTDDVYQKEETTGTMSASNKHSNNNNTGLSEASARRILAEQRAVPAGAQRWATKGNNRNNSSNRNDNDDVPDPDNKSLFVHGLHKDVTGILQSHQGNPVLLQAFQRYAATQVRKPPNAPTSSFCFVDFSTHEQARQCWTECRGNGITVQGVILEVKWASSGNNSRKRNNHDNEDGTANKRHKRLTEAEARDSSTIFFKLPPGQMVETVAEQQAIGEVLRLWMERTLEDALAPEGGGEEDRVTAADEPGLRVQISLPENDGNAKDSDQHQQQQQANYGFLEFASHAAASMALATLTGSTDGGILLPDAPQMPQKDLEGLRLHWGHGKKQRDNERNVIEDDTSGFKFERKHFPADSRQDCWFCLASSGCERHLITGVYDRCYSALAKGPAHVGHVLLISVQHTDQGALLDVQVSQEMDRLKDQLYRHASLTYDSDLFVFERAIQTKGGYHTHVHCVPIPTHLGVKLQATMMSQARKIGMQLREITSDLGMTALVKNNDDDDDDENNNQRQKQHQGYFYAEIITGGGRTKRRFLHKTASNAVVVPLQFGREVLAACLGQPKLAHWKSCVTSQEDETSMATKFRESFAKVQEDQQ